MSSPTPATPSPGPAATAPGRGALSRKAGIALTATATAWFAVAALGQLLFVAYVIGYYGR